MDIHFFHEDVDDPIANSLKIKNWLLEVITNHGYDLIDLNYIFCSDNYLHKINVDYLNHDDLTDIITFDNSEKPSQIEGDIFISTDRVKENAVKYDVPFTNELNRVLVHGLLHLLGYNDKTDKDKELMRKNEDACLSLLPN